MELRSPAPKAKLDRVSDTSPPPRRPTGSPPQGRPGGPSTALNTSDAGLFGPQSVTWRLHAEPLMRLAGLRALLLEALHPVAVAAFEEHRTYQQGVWTRLERTAEYITVTTFAGTTEAMLTASRVRAVHARVRGVLPGGAEYSADDPQLLAWVHCCRVASLLEVLTRAGVALNGQEQDAYIAEQVRAGMLVGLEPDEVPHDRAGLQDYFKVIRPLLECAPIARQAALDLVLTDPADDLGAGPVPETAARRPWAEVAGLAFAALPPWGRRLYALPELPGAAGLPDAATTIGLQRLRAALLDSPGEHAIR